MEKKTFFILLYIIGQLFFIFYFFLNKNFFVLFFIKNGLYENIIYKDPLEYTYVNIRILCLICYFFIFVYIFFILFIFLKKILMLKELYIYVLYILVFFIMASLWSLYFKEYILLSNWISFLSIIVRDKIYDFQPDFIYTFMSLYNDIKDWVLFFFCFILFFIFKMNIYFHAKMHIHIIFYLFVFFMFYFIYFFGSNNWEDVFILSWNSLLIFELINFFAYFLIVLKRKHKSIQNKDD